MRYNLLAILSITCLLASCSADGDKDMFDVARTGYTLFEADFEAVKAGAHAGNILREIAAICGGKGGGRPDSAMGGGKDIDKIPEALKKAEEILSAI